MGGAQARMCTTDRVRLAVPALGPVRGAAGLERGEPFPVFRWSERGAACAVRALHEYVRGVDAKSGLCQVGARGRAGEAAWRLCLQTEFECLRVTQGAAFRMFGSQEGIPEWNRLKGGNYLQQARSCGCESG